MSKTERSILILEDEETTLNVLSETLKNSGYQTYSHDKPDAACVNILVNKKIDLIILDLGLAQFEATSIMKYLRNKDVAKEVPILVISGRSPEEIERSAKELKAKDWISKPFKTEQILKKVKKIIE